MRKLTLSNGGTVCPPVSIHDTRNPQRRSHLTPVDTDTFERAGASNAAPKTAAAKRQRHLCSAFFLYGSSMARCRSTFMSGPNHHPPKPPSSTCYSRVASPRHLLRCCRVKKSNVDREQKNACSRNKSDTLQQCRISSRNMYCMYMLDTCA